MALALVREVPYESYSWEGRSSQWLLLLGEKFPVALALEREVPCYSYSWERSSSQWLFLLGEKFPVALFLEKKPSVALTLRNEVFRGSCSWENDSQRIILRRAVLSRSCSCGSCSCEKSSHFVTLIPRTGHPMALVHI